MRSVCACSYMITTLRLSLQAELLPCFNVARRFAFLDSIATRIICDVELA